MAAIVFDLDGTLIDSAPDLHGVANTLLERDGHAPISLDEARSFVGNGAAVFVARMRAARGIPDDRHDRLLGDFLGLYDGAVTLTRPYPGAIAALQSLGGAGHRLGICTNKPIRPCRAVLAHLQLDRYFDTVWGGDSMPVHKPDPAPLRAAFEALDTRPCLYVGDSEVDAETARNAGIPFVLYTRGYRKSGLDQIPHRAAFDDFAELPALAEALLRDAA